MNRRGSRKGVAAFSLTGPAGMPDKPEKLRVKKATATAAAAPPAQLAALRDRIVALTIQRDAVDEQLRAAKEDLVRGAAGKPLDLGAVRVIFPDPSLRNSIAPTDEIFSQLRELAGRRFGQLFGTFYRPCDEFRLRAFQLLERPSATAVVELLERPSAPRVLVKV